jgi:hypothetical protein
MTVIVDEDFENWNVNSWFIYSDGSQIIYDVGRSGSKGLYLEKSKSFNNKEMIYRYPTAMDELTLTAYINIHLFTVGLLPCDEFIYVEVGGASVAQYMVGIKNIGGVNHFVAYSGATDTYYELQAISYGQWYKIKLVIKRDSTDGYDKLYIDDVLVVDNSGINTDIGGGMDGFYCGMVGGHATTWWFDMDDILIEEVLDLPPASLLPPSCVDSIFKLYIDGNKPPTTERYYMNIHYTKSHPNQDPDTFEITVDPDVGSLINYFDSVKITKYDITEFYGFVEEITPTVGEDGLEYRLTGRCWKLITWKKWTERYQESREIGPVDSEGNVESGFFGQVKPEELLKFVLRCPTSEHPKGKVRHKIGWGIPSDLWTCCANVTAECRYADWVGLRYAGLAWRGRGTVDTLVDYTLDVDAFVNTIQEWFTDGASPWIDSDGGGFIHTDAGTGSQYRMSYFTFENFGVDPQTITNVYLNLDMFGEYWGGRIEVYLWDGAWQYLGKYQVGGANYSHNLTTIDVTQYLDTVAKVNAARVYFKRFDRLWMAIDHCYLTVKGSLAADPADQRIGDYFIVNLGKSYDDVTAILIECRNNPTMYARNYNIQYAIISDCCAEGGNDAQWTDFDPPINETNNDVRDILHSWKPQDDVHCIRIKITGNVDFAWEISQIYIWQSDAYKYRVLDEGD